MGQKANCCNTQNQMNEEKESEIFTDSNLSNISGFSHISNNNLGILNDSNNVSNKKINYFNVYNNNNKKQKKIDSISHNKKVIKIQSIFRMFYVRTLFLNNCSSKKAETIRQLTSNIIQNKENFIINHPSESLHKRFKKYYPDLIYKFNKKKINNKKYSQVSMDNNLINLYPNEFYMGSWNTNKQYDGYGILYIYDEINSIFNKYEGIFENGKLNGFGYGIFSKSQIVYLGDFKENLNNGIGKEIYLGSDNSNFYYFKGKYINGNKIYGILYWKDKSYYKGNFNYNDKFNGKGFYYWGRTNEKYEGEWYDGKMNGQGKMIYADGSIYDGMFYMNKKHGYGCYKWKDTNEEKNKYYLGEWKNDAMNGNGKFCVNGMSTEGIWNNGQLIKIISNEGSLVSTKNETMKDN